MKKLIIGIICLAVVLFVVFVFSFQHYKPFSWDGEQCITYSEECTCWGLLTTFESYPPQYACKGFEFCKDIDVTECEE